jgi:hypothetical protein
MIVCSFEIPCRDHGVSFETKKIFSSPGGVEVRGQQAQSHPSELNILVLTQPLPHGYELLP